MTYPFVICDSDWNSVGYNDELHTPVIDGTNYQGISLKFSQYWYPLGTDQGLVDVSIDGGGTWNNVATYTSTTIQEDTSIDISALADGQPQIMVRWVYLTGGTWQWWWIVDNVVLDGLPTTPGIYLTPATEAASGTPDHLLDLQQNRNQKPQGHCERLLHGQYLGRQLPGLG